MKSISKVLGAKVLDPMDVWGTQAEKAKKDAEKQAALDREAMKASAPGTSPTMNDADVQAARDAEKKRRAQAAGQNSTILTGANGLAGNQGGGKQLLGQ